MARRIRRGCKGGEIRRRAISRRSQTELFRKLLDESEAITVGCTQEASPFEEIAADLDSCGRADLRQHPRDRRLVARGRGCWPKMAALLAAAAEPMPRRELHHADQRGRGAGLMAATKWRSRSATGWPNISTSPSC